MPAGAEEELAGSPAQPPGAEEMAARPDGTLMEGTDPDDEPGTEEQRPTTPTAVKMPSQAEIQAHFGSGHARYRNWCPHCVASKGRGTPHVTSGQTGELPEIGFDYFYLADKAGTGLPNIAATDRNTQSFAGSTVEAKGRNNYATAFLAGWVRGLGYKKVVFASDNEPSILALLADVSASLPEVEIVPRQSVEGDHKGNGLAEVGVREIKGQARVLRSHVEFCYKRRLSRDEPLFAWMVRHAANVINRGRIGSDGKTPEQRRTGKQWKRPSLWFGEQCFFKPAATKAVQGADARMVRGVYIGHHERTGATRILIPEGTARGTGSFTRRGGKAAYAAR